MRNNALPVLLFVLAQISSGQKNPPGAIELGSSVSPNGNGSSNAWFSGSGHFAFGFYPQGNNGYAIGIWLVGSGTEGRTIVWTANRDDPLNDINSELEFTKNGTLVLRSIQGEKKLINLAEAASSATLQDSGNLIFYNKTLYIIWQSFHFPTNTILGGQNLSAGGSLISSKSSSNESSGRFSLAMQEDGNLVAYPTFSAGVDSYWSSGTYGVQKRVLQLFISDRAILRLPTMEGYGDIKNLTETSSYTDSRTVIYRATLEADGNFRLYSHNHFVNGNSAVSVEWSAIVNDPCRPNGICSFNSYCKNITTDQSTCLCFPGFHFFDNKDQTSGCFRNLDDEQGCQRKNPAEYYNITISPGLVADHKNAFRVISTSEPECQRRCLEDCFCAAASFEDGRCYEYKLPLLYGRKLDKATTFFIKNKKAEVVVPVASPPPVIVMQNRKMILYTLIASLGSLTFLCSVIALTSFLLYRHEDKKYTKLSTDDSVGLNEDIKLRSFTFSELEKSTNGFQDEIGRGSLGTVYKGVITGEGKIVAVKKLENPVEGEREFRRVMAAIGQTHHKNLVRLLGFCVEASRKLLVYEYMSNGSLADLLFKAESQMPWKERMRIALDVARGIFYLHEECETPIIHCNIKPRNILLDGSWTAKISDLSVSKLLMPSQTGTYSTIVGIGGYLAPECEKNSSVTTKADVYSFGIVLLEIICCRSHMEVKVSSPDEVLLSTWVYKCLMDGEVDRLVREEVNKRILERAVKVALLCIQNDPNKRPPMKTVVLMLEGIVEVPVPPFPGPIDYSELSIT